jgi:hypothetical protein
MAENLKVSLNRGSGRFVKFSDPNKPLTIKTSAAATTLSSLADTDTSKEEARQSGSTLIYNENTNNYVAEKVFNYNGDDVSLDGGTF